MVPSPYFNPARLSTRFYVGHELVLLRDNYE